MSPAQIMGDYGDVDNDPNPGLAGFQAFKAGGGRGIILQGVYGRSFAGQTPCYRDKIWTRDAPVVVAAGLKLAVYLFVCVPQPASSGITTPEPEVQADALADYVFAGQGPQLKPFRDFAPFFDVEERGTLSPEDYYKWILRVAVRLRQRFGVWPGMYTSNNDWIELLANHPPGPLLNCLLWLAKPWPYKERTPAHMDGLPGFSPTLIPQFGNSWGVYQLQGDAVLVPGFAPGATVDISRVRIYGQGSYGQQTVWTQNCLGPPIKPDGDYGTITTAGVRALQGKYLPPAECDGIVGIDTIPLLMWSNTAPPPVLALASP